MIRVESQRLFLGLLAALIASAWLGLWLWGRSPYGYYLDHSHLPALTGPDIYLLGFFVAGWTLMVFAMMLPASLPLVALFHVMVRDRSNGLLLTGVLVFGYVGVWSICGVAAHVGDMAAHWLVDRSAWLSSNAWVLGSGTLGLAGAYQFTTWKYQCLDQCRSPLTFIMQRWGRHGRFVSALRLGVEHGAYCVGCCWSLMLLMFVVSAGSIGWMLVLGAVMAAERNLSWGRILSRPLGAALIFGAFALAAQALFLD